MESLRLLCVDHHHNTLELRKLVLELAGFAVKTAIPEEAARVAKDWDPTAVLLPRHLPGDDVRPANREVAPTVKFVELDTFTAPEELIAHAHKVNSNDASLI